MRGAWLAFAAVAALILGATALLTLSTIASERRRSGDELLRQALWRLDARAGELLLAAAIGSAERGWLVREGEAAIAYLEVDPAGQVIAASGSWAGDALPAALAAMATALPPPAAPTDGSRQADRLEQQELDTQWNGYGSRASNNLRLQQVAQSIAPLATGPVTARWAAGQLVLVRQVQRDDTMHVQAAVLDWARLQREFAALVADLLPAARLEAVPTTQPGFDCLAALPARLVPGPVALALPPGVGGMLAGAWAAVLAGLGGAAAALAAAHRLAERRATFVSAVTHELRTPLTALRLHADLIADPRVGGDAQRRDGAAQILRHEAARLSRLVDNVLDYARLERRRPPQPQRHDLAMLLPPLLPALSARLAEAGLTLAAEAPPALAVRCDADAVARILANLADNAAKYGRGPVRLTISASGGTVEIRLRDHGPGIAADLRPRLFVPFARSAEAAAGAAPGVGLGLALCRRLARAQSGDLRLEQPIDGPGVCAVLSLPSG